MLLQSNLNKWRLSQLAKIDKLYINSVSTRILQKSKFFCKCYYNGLIFYILYGGQVYHVPLVCRGWSVVCPIWSCMWDQLLAGALFAIAMLAYAVRPDVFEGLGGVKVLLGLGFSRWAYLNRLIPAPSSYCMRCTLILCSGTLYSWMQRCVARTKVMTILLLTYPHVLE